MQSLMEHKEQVGAENVRMNDQHSYIEKRRNDPKYY